MVSKWIQLSSLIVFSDFAADWAELYNRLADRQFVSVLTKFTGSKSKYSEVLAEHFPPGLQRWVEYRFLRGGSSLG